VLSQHLFIATFLMPMVSPRERIRAGAGDTQGEVTVLFLTDKLSLVIFKNGKITEYK
jgi:hypothetical protein